MGPDLFLGLLGPLAVKGAQVELFDLLAGPRSLAQKLQARGDARLIGEATDLDSATHLVPTQMLDQVVEHHFKGDAVKRVLGAFVHGQ